VVLSTSSTTTETTSLRRCYHANVERLRRLQKQSRGTPAYSRLVNRPVARRVAAAAPVVGLSPNGATAISATLSATALTLLMVDEPSLPLGCVVAVLLALGYVLDSVDGQLARLRGGGSAAGEWLDHTVDCVKTCLFHLAVLVSFYRFPPVESDARLVVPIAFLVVDVTCFFGFMLLPALRRANGGGQGGAQVGSPARPEHPARMWLLLPSDYGFFCWIFVLLAWTQVFFVAYTLLFAVNAAFLVLACAKWWRELRALDLQEA
jgi:phosphatidylglycerophosphate synthase